MRFKTEACSAICAEHDADRQSIFDVHARAFPTPAEAQLVNDLRDGEFVRASLVAEVGGKIVGHILFSDLSIVTAASAISALSLAPMAVIPDLQRRGIGSELVRRGLQECRTQGHAIVVVLGHPRYYPRFGFSAKLAEPLLSPYGGRDSWMALELSPGALSGVRGRVEYSPPFGAFE